MCVVQFLGMKKPVGKFADEQAFFNLVHQVRRRMLRILHMLRAALLTDA